MKWMIAAVVVAGWSLVSPAGASAQTADEVVEKHLAAVGGRAALAKITNQAASGMVSIGANGVELNGTVEVWRKTPNKSHSRLTLDLTAMGGTSMVVDQICDGKTAVSKNSIQGDREITGDQLQGMLNAEFPSPLLAYKESGAKIELAGTEKVGPRSAHVLTYTPKTGPSTRLYFDTETFLILKSVAKVNMPEAGGEIEQVTETSDYREVAGVKAPFLIRSSSPLQTVLIKLSKIECNAALDEGLFSRDGK